jgi:hypothetical protein
MGINKAFVVKNSLEVSTDLILANADTRRVGIASTNPQYTLDVAGGIGATDFYLTGIGTFVDELNVGLGGTVLTVLGLGNSIGIGTALPAYLLDIRSPVSTGQTALYVQGDVEITGDIRADDIIFDDAIIDDLIINNTLYNIGVSTFLSYVYIDDTLEVTGITTLGSYVDINDSVDISDDLNVVGLSTLGGYVDINNSLDVAVDLNVAGLTTLGGYVDINDSVDISSNLNVAGLTTLGGYVDINDSVDISSNLNVVGLSTLGGYVDINDSVDISSNLNVVGLSTLGGYVDINDSVDISGSLNVTGIATIATVDINGGDIEVSNVDTTDLNVTGIATIATVDINGGDIEVSNVDTTDLNVTGIATIASVSIVGAALSSLVVTGISTLAIVDINGGDIEVSNVDTVDLNVTGISTLGNVQISSGIITATSGIVTYYGDGSKLTNILSGVGISSLGTLIGIGATILNFIGTAVSTVTVSSGIATIRLDAGAGGGGTPGGSNGQVQYNNFGVFGGSPNFTFDGSNVNVTGVVTATAFYGSGANLTDIVSGVGISTEGGLVGTGATVLNFRGAGISTVTVASGIGTIFIKGGGFSVTNDTSTNSTYYPVFVDSTTGTPIQTSVSNTKLTFNPSTGTLSATQFTSLSDATKKTNIRPIENSIELTKQLEGVRFDWINNNKPSLGLIAQEVEKVLPELVETSTDGTKSVSYGNIVGVLIEAIKEQQVRIEDLEKKVNK